MNELTKAILKTLLVFIVTSLLFGGAVIKFDLGNTIFDSFIFSNTHIMNVITLLTLSLSSCFGYLIAVKKNRNKQNWAVLFFFLHIWGLILLGFLPSVKKDDTK